VTSLDYNLIEDPTGCVFLGSPTNQITGQDPLLEVLGDYGGETNTHLLKPASPAIDAGTATCTDDLGNPLLEDQRGLPRPVDGDGEGTPACDIGSVEVQGYYTLTVALAGTGTVSVASDPAGIDCGEGVRTAPSGMRPAPG
jgi:hypothetical protein